MYRPPIVAPGVAAAPSAAPKRDLTQIDAEDLAGADSIRSVYVYEMPIRIWHWTNALAVVVMGLGLLGRIYWAMAGNYYAKELFWVPIFQLEYWKDAWAMFKWYAFISPRPGLFIGHNPMARISMFLGFLVPSFWMVLTGFAMYSEGEQAGSWYEYLFGWVITLFCQSQDLHTWHHMGMWAMVSFIIVHVYAGVREEILGRTSMISTMVSGHRTFRD